jgi:glutamyl-tRNA reductase
VKILLLGMNHRTASLDLRERHAVDDVRSPLSKLVAEKDIEEAVLVSTCNRVEVVVTTRYPDAARARLRSFIARDLATGDQAIDGSALDEALYEYSEASAVRHVLRVASSVDSLVVGEPQILGQSCRASFSGPSLPRSASATRHGSPSARSRWRTWAWIWPSRSSSPCTTSSP